MRAKKWTRLGRLYDEMCRNTPGTGKHKIDPRLPTSPPTCSTPKAVNFDGQVR